MLSARSRYYAPPFGRGGSSTSAASTPRLSKSSASTPRLHTFDIYSPASPRFARDRVGESAKHEMSQRILSLHRTFNSTGGSLLKPKQNDLDDAATKLQARWRGKESRKKKPPRAFNKHASYKPSQVRKGKPDKLAAPAPIEWKKLTASLPAGGTPEAKAKRKELFKEMDPDNSGYISLDEVLVGVKKLTSGMFDGIGGFDADQVSDGRAQRSRYDALRPTPRPFTS